MQHPAAENGDRHGQTDDRDDEKPGPGVEALARPAAREPDTRPTPGSLRRVAGRLNKLDLDRAVATLGRREDFYPVGSEPDFIAGSERRRFDERTVDLER